MMPVTVYAYAGCAHESASVVKERCQPTTGRLIARLTGSHAHTASAFILGGRETGHPDIWTCMSCSVAKIARMTVRIPSLKIISAVKGQKF